MTNNSQSTNSSESGTGLPLISNRRNNDKDQYFGLDAFFNENATFFKDVYIYGKVFGLEESEVSVSKIVYENSNVTVGAGNAITVTTNNVGIVTFTTENIGVAHTVVLERTGIVQQLFENVNVSSTALTGTIDLDLLSGTLFYYTVNASANWTFNFRGNSSTTLNSILPIGKSVTATILSTQGGTAYYANTFKIDGTTITPNWQGGSTPTSEYTSSINVYTYSIVKTADATFTVLASITKFS